MRVLWTFARAGSIPTVASVSQESRRPVHFLCETFRHPTLSHTIRDTACYLGFGFKTKHQPAPAPLCSKKRLRYRPSRGRLRLWYSQSACCSLQHARLRLLDARPEGTKAAQHIMFKGFRRSPLLQPRCFVFTTSRQRARSTCCPNRVWHKGCTYSECVVAIVAAGGLVLLLVSQVCMRMWGFYSVADRKVYEGLFFTLLEAYHTSKNLSQLKI